MIEQIGIFKLRNARNKCAVKIDFKKAKFPMKYLESVHIEKKPHQNNIIGIALVWNDLAKN